MNNFLPSPGSRISQARVFLSGRHIFNTILQWLAGSTQLTEEEQKDAGIYLGHQHTDKYQHDLQSSTSTFK